MQTAVIDQFMIAGAGTPKSVVLDDDALARAALLGRRVAGQLGRTFEEAEYARRAGAVPALPPRRRGAARPRRSPARRAAPTAGSTDDFTVEWTDLTTSVISMDGEARPLRRDPGHRAEPREGPRDDRGARGDLRGVRPIRHAVVTGRKPWTCLETVARLLRN